ncbi:phage tail assembly chaperone [Pseudorhodoferax sp. Leaf274]|uniref:phage tail assembly chaperone n=1 Tax=Pseudorhodoferax sp. Leaf274 TaxID=1736318 RepID=UPI0007031BCE|nr:phage tail assembly chaperone [Pseudorhodoferax sp. Leaf274]KQP39678.1 hypothetical protein ASF44_08070 [Pseudorhodoferax sp. Leaf274]
MSDTTKLKSIPAARLKSLGTQAPQFDLPITVTKLDGTVAELLLRCNAMRKTEWSKLRDDRHREAVEATLKPAEAEVVQVQRIEDAEPTLITGLLARGYETIVREGLRRDADTVLLFATGWDLDDAFTADALMALEDEFAGSLIAILNAYDLAIYQGRLGNSRP